MRTSPRYICVSYRLILGNAIKRGALWERGHDGILPKPSPSRGMTFLSSARERELFDESRSPASSLPPIAVLNANRIVESQTTFQRVSLSPSPLTESVPAGADSRLDRLSSDLVLARGSACCRRQLFGDSSRGNRRENRLARDYGRGSMQMRDLYERSRRA